VVPVEETKISDKLKTWNEGQLAKHNEYRAKHGAPDLVLDEGLIKLAQAWSEE
jgi:uncharacterized protein YkwD